MSVPEAEITLPPLEESEVLERRLSERSLSVIDRLAPGGAVQPRYIEEGRIGRGGMGEVRVVFDRDLQRHVAKKTAAAAAGPSRRFLDEAQISARLEHPHILPVFDLGLDEAGQLFFTMKRVEDDSTLRRVIERLREGDSATARQYTFARRVHLVQQVCLALSHAHERGVSHRDVKPDNILIGRHGEVYLADWGIAGLRGAPPIGARLDGTLAYMSPERISCTTAEFDVASDVYSLAAVLYELLTLHHHVSEGPSKDLEVMRERLASHRHVDAKLRTDPVHGSVPPALSYVCRRALVDRAYQDPRALHDALQLWREGMAPVVCPRTGIQRVLHAWVRFLDRHRLLGPALTFLVVALLLTSLVLAARGL